MSDNSRRSGDPRVRAGQPSSSAHPGGQRRPAPPAGSARRRLEEFSAPLLLSLHNLPRWLVPVGLALLLFFGLLASGSWAWVGAILLTIIAVFVGWLTALSWPVLNGSSRLIRVLVTAALFGLAVLKALGRW